MKMHLFLQRLYMKSSYTTEINHSRWYWCSRSCDLCVGGNRSSL